MQLHSDIERVIFTESEIKARVTELGQELAFEYRDKEPLVLAVCSD